MATRRRATAAGRRPRKANGQFTRIKRAAKARAVRRTRVRGIGPARKCIGRDSRGRILKGFVLGRGGVRKKRPGKPRVRVTTSGRVREASGQLTLF